MSVGKCHNFTEKVSPCLSLLGAKSLDTERAVVTFMNADVTISPTYCNSHN